jgi:hypothetical protein
VVASVFYLNGSASRDERKYADPDRFDALRNPRDHLAFGYGVHYCLGAQLALEPRHRLRARYLPGRNEIGNAEHVPVMFVPVLRLYSASCSGDVGLVSTRKMYLAIRSPFWGETPTSILFSYETFLMLR